MTDVGTNGERLRGDESANSARFGVGFVDVERVWVLHSLRPAPNIVSRDGIFELRAADGLSDPTVDVGGIERDQFAFFRCHEVFALLARLDPAEPGRILGVRCQIVNGQPL